MPFSIHRKIIVTGGPIPPGSRVRLDDDEAGPVLVFYRAPREGLRNPDDVVSLLQGEGVQTGSLRARNPITHDHWWIPISVLAAAGAPYAKAVASVVQAWLKERGGRKVRFENGRVKITARAPAEAERLLRALAKHANELGFVQVTKAQTGTKTPAKKTTRKRTSK